MARYEIKSAKPKSVVNGSLPREGLVNEVCSEWLLHEDQALAYRLQNEEYENHFGHNRQRNAILRKDAPKAKEEQLKEDEEAARAQTQIEIEHAMQEARDAALAAAIGKELDRQEQEQKRLQELRDQELAKKLIEGEKSKIRQMREIRRKDADGAPSRRNANMNDLSDLSDFCIKPSSSMDEEEMRSLQEDQDEFGSLQELARLLQEQDLKRRGDLLQEDQLLAIEAQDKELAKVLQEQERAKAKKNREKARQKALMKQQQRELENAHDDQEFPPPRPPKLQIPSSRKDIVDPLDSPQYATIPATPPSPMRRSSSPQYATPMLLPRITDTRSPDGGRHKKLPSGDRSNEDRDRPRSFEGDRSPHFSPAPSPGFSNIACVIDPTYQRRVRQGELPLLTQTPPTVLPPNPSPGKSKSPVPLPAFEEEDEYLPPPYMPIQGQRRTASLEKRGQGQKIPKEKVDKSGCRQQ